MDASGKAVVGEGNGLRRVQPLRVVWSSSGEKRPKGAGNWEGIPEEGYLSKGRIQYACQDQPGVRLGQVPACPFQL